jgi:uncharacterized BrkB/YihY/UPF0761 family membrane protein
MSPIGGEEEEGPHMQRPITISIVITIISLFALLRTVRDAITQEYALAPHPFLPFMMLEVAIVVAVTVTVMALLYRWLEPKT